MKVSLAQNIARKATCNRFFVESSAIRTLAVTASPAASLQSGNNYNALHYSSVPRTTDEKDPLSKLKEEFFRQAKESEAFRNDMSYSLSMSSDQSSSLKREFETGRLHPRMKRQLAASENQLRHKRSPSNLDDAPLPRTLQDVYHQKSRAIVVTEAKKPFKVVDVNKTWEGLCGYTYCESKGKTLGQLLHGEETDSIAATNLIFALLSGEEGGTVLTNYTKDGRKFRNRIRVGPIVDEHDKVTHFVGVLQEVHN